MEAGMNEVVRRYGPSGHDRAESSGPCSEMIGVARIRVLVYDWAPIMTQLVHSHLFRKVDRAFPKPANHAEGRAEDCGEERVARAQ